MVNAIVEIANEKTKDQYKVIEDRYATLKRYLRLYFKNHPLMSKEEAELIIKALDDEPLEFDEPQQDN